MIKNFYLIDHQLIALVMVAVLFAACELGRQVGLRNLNESETLRALMAGIGAATLGLLGLLLGFSLSMAIARWDERRDVMITESNAIGTLWLRAKFVNEPNRSELQQSLRNYIEARISLSGPRSTDQERDALRAAAIRSEALHTEIWSVVQRANREEISNAELSSLISAANEVIDLHELRVASIENYLPAQIILLLLAVAALSLGFLGWSFGAATQRSRSALLLLVLVVAAFLLFLMDLNRPQRGALEVGSATLERTRDNMNRPEP